MLLIYLMIKLLLPEENIVSSQLYYQRKNPIVLRLYEGYASYRPLVAILGLGDLRPEIRNTKITGLDIGYYLCRKEKILI